MFDIYFPLYCNGTRILICLYVMEKTNVSLLIFSFNMPTQSTITNAIHISINNLSEVAAFVLNQILMYVCSINYISTILD